jgi:hypothetical protein
MPRHCNPDLSKDWKVVLPATLAGSVEFELLDAATGKPRYGERSRLVAYLLQQWLASRGRFIPLDEPPSPDLVSSGAPTS